MFAISTFTLDYDRAMKILNLLVSDSQIITLLQYGIENEDYTVKVEKVNGKDVETLNLNKDTTYKMNNLYTGSSYYTYPTNGSRIDEWDNVKNANLYLDVSKYVNAQYFLDKATLTDEEKSLLEEREELAGVAKNAFAYVDGLTLAEFDALIQLIANGGDLSIYSEINSFVNEAKYDELISLYNKVIG
jgi:hypothetical protein